MNGARALLLLPPGGRGLVVTEVNADRLPLGPSNPHGNAFRVAETPLLSVHGAMREADPARSRAWKIKNPGVINPITGQPVAFKLVPSGSECPLPSHRAAAAFSRLRPHPPGAFCRR